jgi:hypothetical protein
MKLASTVLGFHHGIWTETFGFHYRIGFHQGIRVSNADFGFYQGIGFHCGISVLDVDFWVSTIGFHRVIVIFSVDSWAVTKELALTWP